MTTKIKSGVISDNAITSAHISSGAISSSHLTSIDTDNITEGSSNLYFTTARVDSHLSGGTGVTYSSGAISIGQSVATTDSPTFANLTLTGNLNITGDVDSVSVTDLDVTDKTITVGVGGTASANDGAGIVVDGASASILWDNSNTSWDFNNPIESNRVNTNTVNNVGNSANIIYRSSTNTIVGNNASALVVQDAGNVGIGTTSPSYPLHVDRGATGDIAHFEGQGSVHLRIGEASNVMYLNANNGSAAIAFRSNDSEKMRIDSSGNVGIGTSSPSYPLHVQIPSDGSIGASFRYTGGTNNPGLFFSTNESTRVSSIDASGSTTGILALKTSGTEAMRIDSSGNVGIGTSNPQTELEISAAQSPFLRLTSEKDGTHDAGDVYGELQFFTQETYGNAPVVSAKIAAEHTRAGTGHSNADAGLVFYTSTATGDATATERMRIESATGNVGIGTTSPSYPLHVVSAATNHQIRVERTGTGNINVGVDTTGGFIEVQSSIPLRFYESSDERMRIDGGNIGINDTSPSQKLSVSGTSSVVPARFTAAGNTNTLEVFGNSTTDTSNGLLVSAGTSSNDYAAYFRKVDGTTPIMMIEGTGNVGIGTSSPGVELDIKRHTNAYPLRVSSEGGQGRAMVFADVASSPSKYNFIAGAQYNVDNAYEITPSTAVGGYTFSNPAIVVLSSGNVGIGTNSPSSALHVRADTGGSDSIMRIRNENTTSRTTTLQLEDYSGSLADGLLKFVFPNAGSTTGSYLGLLYNSAGLYVAPGGNVGIGQTSPSAKIHATIEGSVPTISSNTVAVFNRSGGLSHEAYVSIIGGSTGASTLQFGDTADEDIGKIEYRHASSNADHMAFTVAASERMRIDSSGNVDAAAVKGRFSGYVQDMIHIGADKSEVTRYGNSGKTYTDGGSSNYAGYVYGQETFLPSVFMPYSPNQVYRLSASIYQLTNGTGYSESRHYIGVAGYDENFSFLNIDAIGTYQYNLASNTSLSAGNGLEVDICIKGWQGSGQSNGNKMDEGTVYIRPLILFNYQRSGGTTVLTGFTMMPAGTISDNDSNAGTNY